MCLPDRGWTTWAATLSRLTSVCRGHRRWWRRNEPVQPTCAAAPESIRKYFVVFLFDVSYSFNWSSRISRHVTRRWDRLTSLTLTGRCIFGLNMATRGAILSILIIRHRRLEFFGQHHWSIVCFVKTIEFKQNKRRAKEKNFYRSDETSGNDTPINEMPCVLFFKWNAEKPNNKKTKIKSYKLLFLFGCR